MKTQTLNLKFDIKALSDREFEGYGSVFNNVDLVGDIMAPGSFRKSLAQHKSDGTMPLMFWMHRPDQVAGAWLSMSEDEHGLKVKGVLADTPLGNEMRTLLSMKALRGLSIGFYVRDRVWEEDEEHGAVRVITQADLVEVSLVSLAANPLAEVTASKARLSSDGVYVPSSQETETMLRKGGFSKQASRAMVAKLFGDGATLSTDEGKSGATLDLDGLNIDRLSRLAEVMKTAPAEVVQDRPVPFWRA